MDPRPFLRDHVASRPMIVGGLLALAIGASTGSYLSAGELLPERPAPQLIVATEQTPEPIYYMTDKAGRIPDYVLGTDRLAPPADAIPLERVDWDEAAAPDVLPEPWSAPAQLEPERLAYAPPPSTDGDILRIHDAPPAPDPLVIAEADAPVG